MRTSCLAFLQMRLSIYVFFVCLWDCIVCLWVGIVCSLVCIVCMRVCIVCLWVCIVCFVCLHACLYFLACLYYFSIVCFILITTGMVFSKKYVIMLIALSCIKCLVYIYIYISLSPLLTGALCFTYDMQWWWY